MRHPTLILILTLFLPKMSGFQIDIGYMTLTARSSCASFPDRSIPNREMDDGTGAEREEAPVDMDIAIKRLRSLERHTLERFTANRVKGRKDSIWCRYVARIGKDADDDVPEALWAVPSAIPRPRRTPASGPPGTTDPRQP